MWRDRTWSLVRGAAMLRWALSRWPRRPELDGDEGGSAWARFRRDGGFSGHVHDIFRRRLSPAGKTLCGIWFAAFVVTRIPGGSLADLVFAIVSAAMLVSWVLSWRRPALECAWRLEGALVAGGCAEISLELRNTGTRRIDDPGAWFFRCADGLDFPGDGIHAPSLEPGGRVVLRIPVQGRLRGPSYLDAPHLLALEPLGLMRSSRRASGGCVVAVRPRVPRLTSFRFIGAGAAGAAFAPWLGAKDDRFGDPAGVREYREGDSLHDLHHRSWARLGRPVTRERVAGRGDGIRLVVSSFAEGIEGRMFVDGTLALASSVARWLADRGALGETWLDGERIGGANDPAEALLDACARVPRAGWRTWTRPGLVVPGGDARRPVLIVAAALPREPWAPSPGTKIIAPGWMTDSVSSDAGGRILRYRPDLPFGRDVAL